MQGPSLPFSLAEQPAFLEAALQRRDDAPCLREGDSLLSFGEIRQQALSTAAMLAKHDTPSGEIGVIAHTSYGLLTSILGAWKAGLSPILIDPSSRTELQQLLQTNPALSFLAEPTHLPESRGLVIPPSSPQPSNSTLTCPPPNEPMVTFFTSGSEGSSKCVPKIGRQIYGHIGAVSTMLNVPNHCRALSFVPLFHILGFSYGLMVPLRAGGQTYVLHKSSPTAMRDAILHYQPHLVIGTAVHYRYLTAVLRPKENLPHATYISSGAPLPEKVRRKFVDLTGHPITELYGSTETSGIAQRTGKAPWTPYPGVEVALRQERLWVRSPWATSQAPTTWIETHDIAEVDREGFRLLGRAGNLVKVGGKRFSSQEIAQALRHHPQVQDAAAVPYERPGGEPALAAFVVCPDELSLDELRTYLATQLAPFKLPRTLRRIPQLPRKKLEKLDYASLRALAQQHANDGEI